MGIVAKQSSINALSFYGGFLLAAVNNIILVPWVFSIHPESEWGLLQYLLGLALILIPIAHLGVPNAVVRFMPYFKEKGKAEFLWLTATIVMIGFAITTIGYLVFLWFYQPNDPEGYISSATLLFVIPMLLGQSLTVFFGAISRAMYNSTVPVMVDQLFLRIVTLALLLLYGLQWISFHTFLIVYVSTFLFNGAFMLSYIRKHIALQSAARKYPPRKAVRDIVVFSLFSFLSGEASILFGKVDIIMIKELLDLKSVALYSVPFYVGSLITAPTRALLPISFTLIADLWKRKDLPALGIFYSQSARNQLLVSGFVFLMIWLNIDLLLLVLGDSFGAEHARMVFLFIGLGQLINAAAGTSDQIINASPDYKLSFLFKLILLFTAVSLNFLLIPVMGISGAALSAFFAFLLFTTLKFIFLSRKYNMHPFDLNYLKSCVMIVMPVGIAAVLSWIDNLYMSTVLNILVVMVVFYVGIYHFGVSDEIKMMVNKLIRRFAASISKSEK
jgi:O-antigen/teichoic acid export membrane protein